MATTGIAEERHFTTDHLLVDLKGRSIHAGTVTLISQGIKSLLGLTSTMILARLLTPADFGLVAMVTVVTGFAMLFKDLGLSTAIIQSAQITHNQVSNLFWVNVAVSVMIMIIVAASAPAIAWFYHQPRLTGITLALAGTFVLAGLTVQHQALLNRQMRFPALAAIDIISLLSGVVAGSVAGFLGAKHWALVIMTSATALTNCVVVWRVCPWRPSLPSREAGIRTMLEFGGNVTGFNIVNYFARNADNFLIGWMWGAGPLGLYSRAYQLLLLPIRNINSPIGNVAMPALSRVQHEPARLSRHFLGYLSLITSVNVPIVLIVAIFAKEIVRLLLGPNWEQAAQLFQLLAPAALFGAIVNPAGTLLLATGKSDRYLRQGLFVSPLIVLASILGLPFGCKGVAIGYSIIMGLVTVPIYIYSTRGTGLSARSVFNTMHQTLLAAALAAAGAIIFKSRMAVISSFWLELVGGAGLFLVIYAVVLLGIFKRWHFYWELVKELGTFSGFVPLRKRAAV
jgi:PST family polysaccharide transporter